MFTLILTIYFLLIRFTTRIQWTATSENTLIDFRTRKPLIYTFWNENLLYTLLLFRFSKSVIFLNTKKKSDFLTRLSMVFGFKKVVAVLESGGRQSLLSLQSFLKNNSRVVLPADGSRGPFKKIKTTALLLAQESSKEIIPLKITTKYYINIPYLGDILKLPLPFVSIKIHFGKPLIIKKSMSIDEMEGIKTQISNYLNSN